jgi:uncharacterized protein (TIGR03084 family)
MELQGVYADLAAEGDAFDGLVAGLDETGWTTPTPAPGWTIAHQVAHLAFIVHLARLSAADAAAFEVEAAPARIDFQGTVDAKLAEYLADAPESLLARCHSERAGAAAALAAVPEGQMIPWLVNPLPPAVIASAGIMELFGHGQDIADALGVERERTDRIVHLVFFALLTNSFGYMAHGLTPPKEQFRLELTAPSGTLWEFGPADSTERVTGSAWDFCLLVTRRRHRDDLDLQAHGAEADRWLNVAQAYRGPAGEGRLPGQFASLRAGHAS